jgi:hypothetical protein
MILGIGKRQTILYNVLKQHYPSDHEVTIYESSPYSICDSIIQRIPLKKMPEAVVSAMSTVCSSIGKIFQRQSNVGPVAENHQRVCSRCNQESFCLSYQNKSSPGFRILLDDNHLLLSCLGIERSSLSLE